MGESVECIEIEDDFDIDIADHTEFTLDLIYKRVRVGNWLRGLSITNLILIGSFALYFLIIGGCFWREAMTWEPDGFIEAILAPAIIAAMIAAAMLMLMIGVGVLVIGQVNISFIWGASNIKDGGYYWKGRSTLLGMIIFCIFTGAASILGLVALFYSELPGIRRMMVVSFLAQVIIIGILVYLLDELKDTRWTFDHPFKLFRPKKRSFFRRRGS